VYQNSFYQSLESTSLVESLRRSALDSPHQRDFTFLQDGETEEVSLSYGELDRQARAIGALLQTRKAKGERAILLYQPGLDYIAAFCGCLYAGVVAVPAYPPQFNKPMTRLQSIIKDSEAKFALTTSQIMGNVQRRLGDVPELASLQWIETDDIKERYETIWRDPGVSRDTLAFLQYTSGSTNTPKGVMISHHNLLSNSYLILHNFGHSRERTKGLLWLPLFHDMGLIGGVIQAIYGRGPVVMMAPTSFLQRPYRWLQAITRHRATTSGGPNFAYDLCVRRITEEQKAKLDLSSWDLASCGAEAVRAETLERFAQAFASCGFRREAFHPVYGLAEATLIVTGGKKGVFPAIKAFRRADLEQNRVVEVDIAVEAKVGEQAQIDGHVQVGSQRRQGRVPTEGEAGAQVLVGNGQALAPQKVVIVDPVSLRECSSDQVGEIWVSGPSIAQGYWNRPEETEQTFRACLADSGEGPFMRTGDLGFLQNGELFITGRYKDLIIIDGRNHYPPDIEMSIEQSHPTLQAGACAAFSVDIEGEERLVAIAETTRPPADPEAIIKAVRQAVAEYHDLRVYTVLLLKPGGIPRTSSGKIQRYLCRSSFLSKTLNVWKD
jgi:acyl-CoA synthetase (AMP-forming)/AMP-acid ligase II